MHSIPAFIAVAAAVTMTPGPATALVLQVAAVGGWRAAFANIAGNSVGVVAWAVLSSLGVSALVAANRVAYEALHLGGAAFLVWLGVRALRDSWRAPRECGAMAALDLGLPLTGSILAAARRGLVNSLANPKLAVFFVSLFPQFVTPGTAVLPAALAMAAVIVVFDTIWYGGIAVLVDRFRRALAPGLLRRIERLTGAALVFFGLRLAAEAR